MHERQVFDLVRRQSDDQWKTHISFKSTIIPSVSESHEDPSMFIALLSRLRFWPIPDTRSLSPSYLVLFGQCIIWSSSPIPRASSFPRKVAPSLVKNYTSCDARWCESVLIHYIVTKKKKIYVPMTAGSHISLPLRDMWGSVWTHLALVLKRDAWPTYYLGM